MPGSYKDLLFQKYDAFYMEEHPEKKKLLRMEVVNILREEQQPDSEAYYIWGLTYYMSEEDKSYRTARALEKFLQAYEMDASNFMACLYTAHCYHDQGELEQALKYYELVDQSALKGFQMWRYVKLIEQIGYCNYKLGNEERGRKLFEEVLAWYQKSADDDLAVPAEMMQCLPASDRIVLEMKKIEDYL